MEKRFSVTISIPRTLLLRGEIKHWISYETDTENITFTSHGEDHDFLPEYCEGEYTPVISLRQIVEAYKEGVFKK